MLPKTATHYAKGKVRIVFYRKIQVHKLVNHTHNLWKCEYQFYCPYTDKWLNSHYPHNLEEIK